MLSSLAAINKLADPQLSTLTPQHLNPQLLLRGYSVQAAVLDLFTGHTVAVALSGYLFFGSAINVSRKVLEVCSPHSSQLFACIRTNRQSMFVFQVPSLAVPQ